MLFQVQIKLVRVYSEYVSLSHSKIDGANATGVYPTPKDAVINPKDRSGFLHSQ